MAARGAARLTTAAEAAPPAESGAWAKSLAVIECVAQARGGATAAAVATASGMPVSTVHRLLGQLVAAAVLVREPGSRRYRPGQRLAGLAWTILHHDHDDTRHAILARLVDAIGETLRDTLIQLMTPDRMRGRVKSFDQVFMSAGVYMGHAQLGTAASLMGVPGALVLGGCLGSVAVLLVAKFARTLRNIDT